MQNLKGLNCASCMLGRPSLLPQDFTDCITQLPEEDLPAYFGLPENIDRSAQRIVSNQVMMQLRVLQRSVTEGNKFDKDLLASELGPILNLWKQLNSDIRLIQVKKEEEGRRRRRRKKRRRRQEEEEEGC